MRISQTILTLAPSLLVLSFLWVCWEMVDVFVLYAPHWLLAIAILTLLPLGFQFVRWSFSERRQIPHPFAMVLPLGVLLILPVWSVGEWVASFWPDLCEVNTSVEVKPKQPGKFGPAASFSVGASGRGNPSSFEFTLVTLIYTMYLSERRKDDLYVLLPRWEGFYINSYTKYFPVTREKILEFVQASDDFPEGEAESVTDGLWTALHDLAARRNMPPMVYRDWDHPRPRIVYSVSRRNIYLVTVAACVPMLVVFSWLLAGWYCRHTQGNAEPGGRT